MNAIMLNSRFLMIVFCLLLAGCTTKNDMTFEKINRQLDEASGTENNLWFVPANFSVSSFDVKYEEGKVVYTWNFIFHEKFYRKLLDTKPIIYYKLLFSKEVSKILKVEESDYFQLEPFEPNGDRKYSVELPLTANQEISNHEIELLRDDPDYNLLIFNDQLEPINLFGINKHSADRTIYFE